MPYNLLVVAQPVVDQAAVIVTSIELTRELGVPEERLVHVWGGAGGRETKDLLARESYARSPAMNAALTVALADAGVEAHELDVVDL